MSQYGECECGNPLAPVWFEEAESKIEGGKLSYTGRYRKAVDVLSCSNCWSSYTVDDTFDGMWYKK